MIEAMKQALEALESCDWNDGYMGENQYFDDDKVDNAITSLRQAIQEEALRNVARLGQEIEQDKREWVGLAPTDFDWLEQMFSNKVSNDFIFADIVCAIEAKLKAKNGFLQEEKNT